MDFRFGNYIKSIVYSETINTKVGLRQNIVYSANYLEMKKLCLILGNHLVNGVSKCIEVDGGGLFRYLLQRNYIF